MSTKAIVIAVLVILAIVGVVVYSVHERKQGAVVCQHDDLTAANAERDRYKEQLDAANIQLAKDQKALADAVNKPVTHLVCHQTHPQPAPGETKGQSPAAGVPDPVHGSDFDPSTDLRNLSAGYEGRVEAARDALNKCPGS